MMTTFIAAFSFGAALLSKDSGSYQLKNVPAKSVFERLFEFYDLKPGPGNSFEAKGNRISFDDRSNRINWTNKADDLANLCELFDVKPMPLKVSLVVYSPFYDRSWTSESTVYNNGPFAFENKEYGISILLTPRINGDRTVTVSSRVEGSLVARQLETGILELEQGNKMVTWRQKSDLDEDIELRKVKFMKFVGQKLDGQKAKATDLFYFVSIVVLD